MADAYLKDWQANAIGTTFSGRHFGANVISFKNDFVEGGPLDNVLNMLNPTSIRYPGGTVTEDNLDPRSAFFERLFEEKNSSTVKLAAGGQMPTVRSTMAYAAEHNMSVDFVLPTEHLLKAGPNGTRVIDDGAVAKLMSKVDGLLDGRYGDARIGTFELGNEYFVQGRMTPQEYGAVANRLTLELSESFDRYTQEHPDDHTWHEPDVAVQSGAGWMPGHNDVIIASLSSQARAEIDAVIGHYYPKELAHIDNFQNFYANLHAWEAAPGFHNIDISVSEWNVQNTPASDHGLYQASSFVSAMHEMGEQGVDAASVWGIQSKLVGSSLSFIKDPTSDTPGTDLTATGYVFQQMRSDLIGLKSLYINPDHFVSAPDNTAIDVESFGNADHSVIYISSRSDADQQIDLNLDDYFKGATHVSAMRVSAIDDPRTADIDESDPHASSARIGVHGLSATDLADNQGQITLHPGEILQLKIDFGHDGVRMAGYNPTDPIPGDHYSDTFDGSAYDDRLYGFAGDDSLHGANGQDLIVGGTGADNLSGGVGNDVLLGGSGSDTLYGGPGTDILRGGNGDDTIFGGDGDDRLDDGQGNDVLAGGTGNDTLLSTSGDNALTGAEGSDLFLASVDANTDITDFNARDGDRLGFFGQYEDTKDLMAHVTVVDSENGENQDLLVSHDTGHVTRLVGAGDQYASLADSNTDLPDDTQTAVHLANSLNALTPVQIGAYMSDLDSADFDQQIMGVDPDTLLSHLNGVPASAFINGMLSDEADDFLNSVSDKSYTHFVKSLGNKDLVSFLNELNNDHLETFLSSLPDNALNYVNSVAEINDHGDYTTDIIHDVPIDNPSDFLPQIPVNEYETPPDEPQDEDLADSAVASSDCFVASAAYRDPLHPDVVVLRAFRERVLKTTAAGRAFIDFYWWIGPKIARPVYRNPSLGAISKAPLKLIVTYLKWRYRNLLT